MVDRPPGFYVIRQTSCQEPEPARWDGDAWILLGVDVAVLDEDVEEVIGPLDLTPARS